MSKIALGLRFAALMAVAPVMAGTAVTGAWFSPEAPGQGLVVEQLKGAGAVMLWHGVDASGRPALAYIDGQMEADRLVGRAFHVSGPRFGEFDPTDLRMLDAGTVALQADACGTGVFTVETQGGSTESLPSAPRGQIRWLAAPAAGPCATGAGEAGPLTRMSGTWAHPQLAGQGISVQFLDADHALVFWHTFDQLGNPRLLYLEASREDTRLRGTVYAGRDGLAPGFSAGGPADIPWGEAQVDFIDCRQASLTYQPRWRPGSADRSPGTLPLLRLTIPEGIACDDASQLPEGFARRFEGTLRTGSQALGADAVLTSEDELIVTIAGLGTYRGGFTADADPQLVLDGFGRSRTLGLGGPGADIDALLQDSDGGTIGRLRLQDSADGTAPRSLAEWAGQFGALSLTADGRVFGEQRSGGILGLDRTLYEGSIRLHPDGLSFDTDLTVTHTSAVGEDRTRYFGAGWFANDGPRGTLRLHQRLRSVDGQRSLSLIWPQ